MIEPKEIIIDGRTFILSKFPAVAGREIITKYPTSIVPKVGDYKVNEATMLKLMSYVGIPTQEGVPLMLTSQALIDNHVGSWETLAKVEIAMMEYNCSFFQNGRASTLLNDIAQKIPALITKIWTDLSQPSSPTEKQH